MLARLLAILVLTGCSASWELVDTPGIGDPVPDPAVDDDGDGFSKDAGDCDDADGTVYPGAPEACDGADQDCDGQIDEDATTQVWDDADADGWGAGASRQGCADEPGTATRDGDCDDQDADLSPDGVETCDGRDEDCDGVADDAAGDIWYTDADGDGWGDASTARTQCDGDGATSRAGDCDDADAGVSPGAPETCDGTDDDCDGEVDEGVLDTFWRDADGDGQGTSAELLEACVAPSGYVADARDCDDADPTAFVGAPEVCDGADDDCDGTIDEDDALDAATWHADTDGDGYGDPAAPTDACAQPAGHVSNARDCDDADPDVSPSASEACNGIDDDCDGSADDSSAVDATTWYRDVDSDGYGGSTTVAACSVPTGFVAAGGDCDDLRAAAYPGASETCNGADDDCDGSTDEAGASGGTTWYRDADGDGYGAATSPLTACTVPSGYVASSTDCNDAASSINPAATESCNSVDDDCDGATDESGATGARAWYRDADGDDWGVSTSVITACSAPSGYVADAGDCLDSDATVSPDAVDECDAFDNDCDGSTDNGGLCPCAVQERSGSVYMFCTGATSWTNASSSCAYYGYALATVNDAAENAWIGAAMVSYATANWWIGLNDRGTEGTWAWDSGSAATYRNWESGEPNDYLGEDCVELRSSDYQWNDEDCTASSRRYVCEG